MKKDIQALELEKGPPLFSYEEITDAFKALVQSKIKNKRRSNAFKEFELFYNPKKFSLLPVGVDGQTTIHVYESEEKKEAFLWGIYRLVNDFEKVRVHVPRFAFKKFKVVEYETKPGKLRKISIPCLRDQVVVRCILNRLNQIGIVDSENKPNQNIPTLTAKIKGLINAHPNRQIIRTDIKDFYPSVNTEKLLSLLQTTHGNVIGARLMDLIRKSILDNKSASLYTGLPLGMGTSVLFANYYISQLGLANFYKGVNVIRYEDDLIMFLDEGVDPEDVKAKLDEKLSEFGLTRNDDKTEILSCMDQFVFLGVSYDKGNVSVTEERLKKWKEDVKSDVHGEILNYRTLELIKPDAVIPERKAIVDMVWKQHIRGKRSYLHQHYLKIKAINENG
jgi:hypothetical protein